jgi:cell division septation protein DedD
MLQIVKRVFAVITDERGSIDQMVWVLGSAVIVALVVVVLIALAKGTASTYWTDATGWIETTIGF